MDQHPWQSFSRKGSVVRITISTVCVCVLVVAYKACTTQHYERVWSSPLIMTTEGKAERCCWACVLCLQYFLKLHCKVTLQSYTAKLHCSVFTCGCTGVTAALHLPCIMLTFQMMLSMLGEVVEPACWHVTLLLLIFRRRRARESIKSLNAPEPQASPSHMTLVQPMTDVELTASAEASSSHANPSNGSPPRSKSQKGFAAKTRGLSTIGLTPGTPLMAEIERSLEFYICQRLQKWRHLQFELSGARVQVILLCTPKLDLSYDCLDASSMHAFHDLLVLRDILYLSLASLHRHTELRSAFHWHHIWLVAEYTARRL